MLAGTQNAATEKPIFGHVAEKILGENRIGKNYFVVTKFLETRSLRKTYETVVYFLSHPDSKRQTLYKTSRVCLVPHEAERLHEQGIRLAKMLAKSKTKRFVQ